MKQHDEKKLSSDDKRYQKDKKFQFETHENKTKDLHIMHNNSQIQNTNLFYKI